MGVCCWGGVGCWVFCLVWWGRFFVLGLLLIVCVVGVNVWLILVLFFWGLCCYSCELVCCVGLLCCVREYWGIGCGWFLGNVWWFYWWFLDCGEWCFELGGCFGNFVCCCWGILLWFWCCLVFVWGIGWDFCWCLKWLCFVLNVVLDKGV